MLGRKGFWAEKIGKSGKYCWDKEKGRKGACLDWFRDLQIL